MPQYNCYTVAANRVRRYIGIHNFHHIKTYMFKQTHSSRRASNERPYGFATFIKYVFTYNLYFIKSEKIASMPYSGI